MGAYENSFNGTAHYVSLSNLNPVAPYTDLSTAATNIQDAIDAASDGEYVVVTAGIYKTGGRVVYGSLTNRVVIDKAVTVQSVDGPDGTVIQGNRLAGNTAVRCVYLTEQAALVGITLSNGATASSGDAIKEESGAGVWCESVNAFITNCVITRGWAADYGGGIFSGTVVNSAITSCQGNISGGGAYGSTLVNCLVSNNVASSLGGGAIGGSLIGCVISTNHAIFGAGACSNILLNCTLMNNLARRTGGGTYACAVTNCFLSANSATNGGGAVYGLLNNCTLSGNLALNGGGTLSNILLNCLINNNAASSNGGGAYACGLTGCTLQGNGAVDYGGGSFYANLTNCNIQWNGASYGGGVAGGTCVGCMISNNQASFVGGGVYSNTASSCTISSNYNCGAYFSTLNSCWVTWNNGGGAGASTLNNCLVQYNFNGDGASSSTLVNCTVRNNSFASPAYYGVRNCRVTNSIVYNNYVNNNNNYFYTLGGFPPMAYCCTLPLPATPSAGNFTNNPLFFSELRLQSNSPCINAGNNTYTTGDVDVFGRPRIIGGTVDIGACEYQGVGMESFITWMFQHNLPIDGSADYADTDGDGMNNWQEWIAGVDPTDATSVLKMVSPIQTNDPAGKLVSWQSVPNIIYYLQRSTNLVAFSTVQSNLIGQINTTTYTDTSATNAGPYFYRVGVQ